jgi:arylsulfate sulfotransferase
MKNFISLSALVLAVFLAGCGGGSTSAPVITQVVVTPSPAAVALGAAIPFSAAVTGNTPNLAVTWAVNATVGGSSTLGTIDGNGVYTAPAANPGVAISVSATSVADPQSSSSASVHLVTPGAVTATTHPLVALYTINPGTNGTVTVQFGPDTNYGFATSAVTLPTDGTAAAIQVAGMKASTPYHMRAQVTFGDGSIYNDPDQTFTTGSTSSFKFAPLTITTTPGATPQPGIEMVNGVTNGAIEAYAIDLTGNVLWFYNFAGQAGSGGAFVQPVKQLPNGHMLLLISASSELPLTTPIAPPILSVLREVDFIGNTIRELSIYDLNAKMTAAGFNVPLQLFHHDVLPLANGHWIVLSNTLKTFTDLVAQPSPTTVLGDVIIDLDANLNPVWVWNEFDHLDPNRHPYMFPDWTHTNAVIYSPDDGNLLVSIRHQNWVVKVDYNNGTGSGDILWRLGQGGDFTLAGGTDPADWFYAQHGPSFVSPNTTGKFSLTLFDNGDDRIFPNGFTCSPTTTPPCHYSTVPILDIDEQAKTATLDFHYTLPQYSNFGGNAEVLKNGNMEFDVCGATLSPTASSDIYEVTQTDAPQTVWHMNVTTQNVYRAMRVPSLYPNVQW